MSMACTGAPAADDGSSFTEIFTASAVSKTIVRVITSTSKMADVDLAAEICGRTLFGLAKCCRPMDSNLPSQLRKSATSSFRLGPPASSIPRPICGVGRKRATRLLLKSIKIQRHLLPSPTIHFSAKPAKFCRHLLNRFMFTKIAVLSSIFRAFIASRSEEHTSELQSPDHLVCRLLLEKKKKNTPTS